MPDSAPPFPAVPEILDGLRTVLEAPLLGIASALSALLAPEIGHRALVIFTEDCTGRPQKKAGDPQVTDRVTIAELDAVRAAIPAGESAQWGVDREIAGSVHHVAVWHAATGAILVLVDPDAASDSTASESAASLSAVVGSMWQIVALSIRQQVAAAPTSYLLDSRAASAERSRVIAELTDAHASTLESLLAVLRSHRTGDAAARQTAAELATSAMVQLRSQSDRDRSLAEEPVASAFERLRGDLLPLVRFGNLEVQFVEPPVDGRALPGEVAHAARAIVRGAVLALIEQPGVGRVRVQWDCDGSNLLIGIRDDGPGDLTPNVPSVRQLSDRVTALEGTLNVEGTAGWGSSMAVTLPLDAPSGMIANQSEWGLSARERDVLELVASGARNRSIAASLSVSENTVKFHVSNLLRKMGATSRAELAALAR